jgi:hypothetical protein
LGGLEVWTRYAAFSLAARFLTNDAAKGVFELGGFSFDILAEGGIDESSVGGSTAGRVRNRAEMNDKIFVEAYRDLDFPFSRGGSGTTRRRFPWLKSYWFFVFVSGILGSHRH